MLDGRSRIVLLSTSMVAGCVVLCVAELSFENRFRTMQQDCLFLQVRSARLIRLLLLSSLQWQDGDKMVLPRKVSIGLTFMREVHVRRTNSFRITPTTVCVAGTVVGECYIEAESAFNGHMTRSPSVTL